MACEDITFIQLIKPCIFINVNRNRDLSEQCLTLQKEKANLIKDKEDAQKQIRELMRTSQSMERKIESLTNELTK